MFLSDKKEISYMLHEKHNKKITFRIKESTYDIIKDYSEFNNISFSRALELIIEKGIYSDENENSNKYN